MKKRMFSVFLALILAASFTSCAVKDSPSEDTTDGNMQPSNSASEVTTALDDTKTETESNSVTETETTPPLSNVEEYEFFYDYWLEGDDTAVKRGDQILLYTYVKNVTDRDITYWGTSNFLMPIAEVFTTDSEGVRYSIPYMIAGNADADNLHTFPAGGARSNTAWIDIPLDAPAGQYSLEIYLNETPIRILICENLFVLDELPAETAETAE